MSMIQEPAVSSRSKQLLRWLTVGLMFAMGPAVSSNAAEHTDNTIEEVVVTAQKRSQSLNEIGVSVSVFTGTDTEELGLRQFKDVANHTPGLSTVDIVTSGMPVFAIRGIGLDDFNANNTSGVAIYQDEVYAPYPMFLNGQLFDIDRIEVVRGPQGTLYGKNSTGGAINYISVRPDQETNGYITASYGRWNSLNVEAAIGGALSESISTRLAISYGDGDGFQEDIHTGRDYGTTDRFAARWSNVIRFGQAADLLLVVKGTRDKSRPGSPHNAGVDGLFGLPANTIGVADGDAGDVNVGSLPVSRDEEGLSASANLSVRFDTFDFNSITAWGRWERSTVENLDGASLLLIDITFDDETDYFSQEIRLTSKGTSSFNWVAGLVYSYDEVDTRSDIIITDFIDTTLALLAGTPLGFVPDSRIQVAGVQDTTSFGAYVHTETSLSEDLKLTAGLRYSQDEREFDGAAINPDGWLATFGGSPFPIPELPVAGIDDSEDETNVSGKIGLDYFVNDRAMIYAGVSTSYKGGVYYASTPFDPSAWGYVDPEEILAYELGFKVSLLDSSMQINGSIFQYDYDDRQSLVTATNPLIPDSIYVTLENVGNSEIRGGELEMRWLPFAGFDLRFGVAYLDTEVTEMLAETRGNPLLVPIAEGSVLGQAPEWSYTTIARYEWNLSNMLAALQVDFSHKGEQVGALAGGPDSDYGAIDNLGARFSISGANEKWSIAIWGRNLQDNFESVYGYTSLEGGRAFFVQHPRSYGIDFTYYLN